MLAARAMAPVARGAFARVSADGPRPHRPPAPARVDAAAARDRARARAGDPGCARRRRRGPGPVRRERSPGLASPLAVSLVVLAVGLVLAELVSSRVRRGAASLRDAARQAAQATQHGIAGSGEFSEVSEALAGLSRAIHGALEAFYGRGNRARRRNPGPGRDARVGRRVDRRSGRRRAAPHAVDELGYSHAERISESIQDLRIAVDESSSAVTELGAAGEQLVGTAREMTSRADTVSRRSSARSRTLGDVRPRPTCSPASRATPPRRWKRWRPR